MRGQRTEDRRQKTVETTFNQKLLQGVQMLHGAVFSKRVPLRREIDVEIYSGKYYYNRVR
jgi:hypothetical protein